VSPRRLWRKLRRRSSRQTDPFDIETKSYKEMALDNAAEAIRLVDDLDDYRYPDPPLPGVDYDEVDVPPEVRERMAAKMEEVYVYTARERGREVQRVARRRRRVVALVATGVLVLTSAAGASALFSGTTGLKVIDRLLAIDMHEQGRARRHSVARPSMSRVQRDPRATGISLEVPVGGEQSRRVVGAFLNTMGEVCFTLADSSSRPRASGRTHVGCAPGNRIRQVPKRVVYVSTIFVNRAAVVLGFASSDVTKLRIRGPSGPLVVKLGSPWRTRIVKASPVRIFLAAASDPRLDHESVSTTLSSRYENAANYRIKATMSDGHVVRPKP
jgi:hypothetical protein